jgi:hypothetical protein
MVRALFRRERMKTKPEGLLWKGDEYLITDSGHYARAPKKGEKLRRPVYLHREIWRAANGKIPHRRVVHHINLDTSDNRLSNLMLMEWTVHERYHDWIHELVTEAYERKLERTPPWQTRRRAWLQRKIIQPRYETMSRA